VPDIVIAGKSDHVKGHEQPSGRNNSGKNVRKVVQGECRARHNRVSPEIQMESNDRFAKINIHDNSLVMFICETRYNVESNHKMEILS
jgi:NCAIR mutase (PurE)-related protein